MDNLVFPRLFASVFSGKSIFTLLLLLSFTHPAFSDGGVGYKGIYINKNGTKTWYKAHTVAWSYNGCGNYQFNSASDFSGQNLGSFTSSQDLQISGFAVIGWTNNTDYVSGRLQYRIWRQGDIEPGTWNNIDIGNYGNYSGGATQVVCSSDNDRVVGYDNGSTNINPGAPGTYNFKVKALGQMQWSGSYFNVNDGPEVTATFTITSSATDHFRSKATGNWNVVSNWESSSNNTNWAESTLAPGSSANNILVRSDHTITITGSETASSLTVENTATLKINMTKSLIVSGGLTVNGTLSIESDDTGTGSLITNGTVSGNVTVQRYLSQNLFHYISCPINYTSGTFSTLSMGLASGDDFRRYETSTNTWIDILNGPDGTFGNSDDLMDDETFVQGKGYAIAYAGENKTLSFTGSPNNGNIEVAVTAGGVGNNSGACFVGNPYPSTLKASDFLAANNSTNGSINQTIRGTLYFWDEPGSGGFEKADYATLTSSTGNPGGGSKTPTDYINPGQGFFVSAVASGNVAFRNAQRAHGSSVFFKEELLLKDFKLQVKNLETSDQNTITVVFDDNSSEGFDELYDAHKWSGNPDLALYSLLGEQKLAIQSLPDSDAPTTVNIGLKVSSSGNFLFSVYSIANFESGTPITLEDKLTGDQIDLTINPEYSFSVSEAGTYNDRFVLHFKSGVGISDPSTTCEPIIYLQNSQLAIKNLQPGNYSVRVSDMTGRQVAAKQVSADGPISLPLSLQTGIYIVEVSSETSKYANKIFIK